MYCKQARMIQKPGPFGPDQLDTYVRFEGRLMNENLYKLPIYKKKCAFFDSKIFAEWETKKKKPDRGMETNRKKIFHDQPQFFSNELQLDSKNYQVYINAEDFEKGLVLSKIENIQLQCPVKAKEKYNKKYERYHLIEKYAEKGEYIIAQGKLALHPDGRLFIKPANFREFPSFISTQKDEIFSKFLKSTTSRVKSNIRRSCIKIAFGTFNAAMIFLYGLQYCFRSF